MWNPSNYNHVPSLFPLVYAKLLEVGFWQTAQRCWAGKIHENAIVSFLTVQFSIKCREQQCESEDWICSKSSIKGSSFAKDRLYQSNLKNCNLIWKHHSAFLPPDLNWWQAIKFLCGPLEFNRWGFPNFIILKAFQMYIISKALWDNSIKRLWCLYEGFGEHCLNDRLLR